VLLDPTAAGLGRVLFAPVSRGGSRTLSLQLPVPDLVVLQPAAYLLPLLAVHDICTPAGVAVVSRDGARLLEWAQGQVTALDTFRFEAAVGQWRELKGPPPANPALANKAASQRDLFERRLDGLVAKFLHDTGRRIAHQTADRGWDELVMAGDPRLAEAFEAGVRAGNARLTTVLVPQVLTSASPAQIAAAVTPDLLRLREAAHAALAGQVRAAALSGGPGAYGLADTLAALQEGRVARLLLDGAGRWEGSRAPDGALVPDGELPPGVDPDLLVPEPLLAERMVERALAAGADITILAGPAAAALAPAGVAAMLRW
jgi:hypothetical protein